MKLHGNTRNETNPHYVAPILGNGSLSFQVDYEGTMMHDANSRDIHTNSDMRIWWAGRRYVHKPKKDFVSFGRFGHTVPGILEEFTQELDTENALVMTDCTYSGGNTVHSEILVHHDENLIAVKKQTQGQYSFEYHLCGMEGNDVLPELMTVTNALVNSDGVAIHYNVKAGMYPYEGVIHVFCDSPAKASWSGNKVTLTVSGDAVCYILFADNMDSEDYIAMAESKKQAVLNAGYPALRESHIAAWRAYYAEGNAQIGDQLIDQVYKTAQYHLKCYTTQWSIPVGLSNGNWHGKYFAFDEFYMLMGLLTSNHKNAAKRVPEFRHKGLHTALFRASHPEHLRTARYPWETLENGTEGSISGFWHDHVFHMACIAGGAYQYYRFTNDLQFLQDTGLPLIKACARFYLDHMIYATAANKAIVGKCTDLERLGAAHENAYMTTCGVIMNLEIFAEVAKLLDVEEAMAAECIKQAVALRNGLPTDGEKFVPYPDCPTTSIGLLSGTYPFDVIDRDDPRQWPGINEYLDSEQNVGNMYATGTGVCAWYQTWKALVFARHGKAEETLAAIRAAAVNSGDFGEMYEINDRSTMTIYRPWFTTAAGMLVHAVNEMLLQQVGDTLYVGAALPETIREFSFKLATNGGTVVEATAKDGVLTKLNITGTNADKLTVVLPPHITNEVQK